MISNPYEECPPDEPVMGITIHCVLEPKIGTKESIWSIYCPQWKCHIHDTSLTRGISKITSDIEAHN